MFKACKLLPFQRGNGIHPFQWKTDHSDNMGKDVRFQVLRVHTHLGAKPKKITDLRNVCTTHIISLLQKLPFFKVVAISKGLLSEQLWSGSVSQYVGLCGIQGPKVCRVFIFALHEVEKNHLKTLVLLISCFVLY